MSARPGRHGHQVELPRVLTAHVARQLGLSRSAVRHAIAHYPPSRIRDGGLDWAREVEMWLRYRADELGVAYRVRPYAVRPGPGGAAAYVLPAVRTSR